MPRPPHTSPTARQLSDRIFSELVARARAREGPVFPLHVGDTWLEPLESARCEALSTQAHPGLHQYAPVQGDPSLLQAITNRVQVRYGITLDPMYVQVMSGGTSGLSVVASALLDPGDEVLLPSPYWPLIRGIVAARGAVAVQVPFYTRLGEPGFDPEAALEARVTPRTVALYVNTPNNPTGRVLPRGALDALERVALRHDLWVLTDEAYEDLHFTPAAEPPFWARPSLRERAVATHTLSKGYGLAGLRVGFTHGPPSALGAIRAAQTFQTYCASRPSQVAAGRALREGEAWVSRARALYQAAGARAAEVFGVPAPEAGTFLFVPVGRWLREGEGDCSGFLGRCLDAGVLLTPGTACGEDFTEYVRLCFTAVPPEALEEALGALSAVLREG
ncbi:MAG: pyridoxal phosphate-dependent aminotransferase [Deltaproteobacteria bacterium]|nr:pyridoxal phosphate-dependent aminotransferase [Deltaproteobacteria bacterium]